MGRIPESALYAAFVGMYNKLKQNAGIVAALYGLGVFWGVIIRVCGIVF